MRGGIVAVSVLAIAGTLALLPGSGEARGAAVGLRLTGSIEGLYPGAHRFLAVKVRNRYPRAVRLVSVTAQVRGPRRRCTRWNLDVRPFRGRLTIRRGRTGVVRLLVRMPHTAAQECSGARFPLVFRAKAVVQ